jgi:hypothetical protein
MTSWPVSLIVNPPKIETGFVWQLDDAQEEQKLLVQKLGLDTSPIKKIFYNTKTTILFDRYTKNVLVVADFTNYFFTSQQLKFPYPMLIGFLTGVYVSIKKKRHLKVWLTGLGIVLLVSLLKKIDGIDFMMYPIIGFITVCGLKEISKYKFGQLVVIVITIIGLTEIWRVVA